MRRPFANFGGIFPRRKADPVAEQKRLLQDRERIEKRLAELESTRRIEHVRARLQSVDTHTALRNARKSDESGQTHTARHVSWSDGYTAPGRGEDHLTYIDSDIMPPRINITSKRRNALGHKSHRKSLMQGILSVASGDGNTPSSELKEGKKLPDYLTGDLHDDSYRLPSCSYKSLRDPDEFYEKTYIVVNHQGTTFRFSESKSLFLFDRESKVRQFCINLFIRPLFSHFIMLVILANCVCMMLAEPPAWIENYLEYVFTAIYCLEAGIKIIGRGFFLHRFSYLRDPWNWLDFIVIVFAIITEVLKAAMSSSLVGQFSVLRAFRVLRALKTMSVVPGLRGIVKALLRSIRALQDAVVLTIFCVSVFALIGYQLFNGTLRNKCVLIPGSTETGPDAIYLVDWSIYPNIEHLEMNSTAAAPISAFSPQIPDNFTLPFVSKPLCNTPCGGLSSCSEKTDFIATQEWVQSDTYLTRDIFLTVNETIYNTTNTTSGDAECAQLLQDCVVFERFETQTNVHSSILRMSTLMQPEKNTDPQYEWECGIYEAPNRTSTVTESINGIYTTTQAGAEYTTGTTVSSHFWNPCNVSVIIAGADISCMYDKLGMERIRNTSADLMTHTCYDNNTWMKTLHFGEQSVPRWRTRKNAIFFRLFPPNAADSGDSDVIFHEKSFLLFGEYERKELSEEVEKEWDCHDGNYVMRNVDAGMYFYIDSSNRPGKEPLYCKIGDTSVCPKAYECREAGGNPDFGYTNFDHFFWAFLTSFRLIAQDAWSRLFYLTLHTIGKTYVIFYIIVMFLGSYYLINLILAVVYMAYEEQQAVAEDEALEEEEHKAERREIDASSEEDLCRSKDEDSGSRSSVKSCCLAEEGRRFGLITTSLTSITDSGVTRRSHRCSRRQRYGQRRPPSKTDQQSEILYRKYTRRHGDGLSAHTSTEGGRERHRSRRKHEPFRQDSLVSVGSFTTVSEQNSCSRCDSRKDRTGSCAFAKYYCPRCRSGRARPLQRSKTNIDSHERKLAAIENESVIISADPQIKLIVTPETPVAVPGDCYLHAFLTTPEPIGAQLKNSNLNVLAVDFAPGRSSSICSTASDPSECYELESDQDFKGQPNQNGIHASFGPSSFKKNSDNLRASYLPVPSDRSSQYSCSLSSTTGVDGAEQIIQAEVTPFRHLGQPSSVESTQHAHCLVSAPRCLKTPPPCVKSNGMAGGNKISSTPLQVPSLMVTSASSEHIIGLNDQEYELGHENRPHKTILGGKAKCSLPTITGSPILKPTCDTTIQNSTSGRNKIAKSYANQKSCQDGIIPRRARHNGLTCEGIAFHHSSPDLDHSKQIDLDHVGPTSARVSRRGKLCAAPSPPRLHKFFRGNSESHEDGMALTTIAAHLTTADEGDNLNQTGTALKRFTKNFSRNAKRTLIDVFCKWSCCTIRWARFQGMIRTFVLDPFMDLFITLCIFLNTIFMMLEYHPMELPHQILLERANLAFTTIFALEMFLKVIGLGPYTYFREAWNMFDAVVVVSSLLEIILQTIPGLSVLRAFRLMRIVKLAKSWPTLNKLLRIIGKTLGKLWHLTLVFLLVMFIFAVVGMQLLREQYKTVYGDNMPRWNFVDFPHAFMVVFRIQCGEWIENMFACMNVASAGICIPLFILVLVIGNLVILNLFLALLLNSFSGDALQRTDTERNSLAEAWQRISRWMHKATRAFIGCNIVTNCCSKLQLQFCLRQRGEPSCSCKTTTKHCGKRKKKRYQAAEASKTETTKLCNSESELPKENCLKKSDTEGNSVPEKLDSADKIAKLSQNSNSEYNNETHLPSTTGDNPSNTSPVKTSHHHRRHYTYHGQGENDVSVNKCTDNNQNRAPCVVICNGCHVAYSPNPVKSHRRTRVREGFAPAAAFQNRPDDANEALEMISHCDEDEACRHPRRAFQTYNRIEYTRTSSQDRPRLDEKKSSQNSDIVGSFSSDDRHVKHRRFRHQGGENPPQHSSPKKYLIDGIGDKHFDGKHSKHGSAEETDVLLNGENRSRQTSMSSRQTTKRNDSIAMGESSRRKSNTSVQSTRNNSSSGRSRRSYSRSGSQASCEYEKGAEDDKKMDHEIPQCFPPYWTNKTEGKWWRVRVFCYNVAVHRYFENIVIFCILLSSIALAFEDIHLQERPAMATVLDAMDKFFCTFFAIEMLIKWIGFGLRYYFTNEWCLLDFVIVFFSLLDLCLSLTGGATDQLGALRVLRTFRALRPLRALSRFEGMKVVVDALVRAIPSIFHVFLVCVIVWLIFSILGVNLFGGRFGRCVMFSGTSGIILPRRDNSTDPGHDFNITTSCIPNSTFPLDESDIPAVRNRKECEECAKMMGTEEIRWVTPSVNFDNVGQGFLALMQVATFKGWLEIMANAVDITGIEEQPSYENSFYYYTYFCIFIVFGAFFSLNLFIGVIIDNFNQQKGKGTGGEDGVFLTDEQKRYYNAMKRMAAKAPSKPIPRPNSWFANKVYDIVTDRKFEMAVMAMILLNMVVMAIEHYDMSKEMDTVLQHFNLVFICVFFVEAVLKLIGLRLYYFTVPWNVFDVIVVVVSIIVSALSEMIEKYFVQPTLFRIIRLFRVTRILRLIREAKGIRTLLFALMMSIPALFNIGSLLFLVIFIYAILGMSQFAYVQKIAGVDDLLNFETFPNSFLVLFQVSTSEGWNTFIEPVLRDKPPFCDPNFPKHAGNGNCGNAAVGVAYFVTFVLITFLIVINMYIAIILENFEVATRESSEPLTADDFEQFFEVWQRYDDKLSQFVTMDQLQHFLHHLDYPLRVPFPNRAFIVNARMKITKSGSVHCLEVIIALIKKVLGDSPELNTFKDAMLQSFMLKCKSKEPLEEEDMIDTMEYERRRRSAIVIQKAYRKWKDPSSKSASSEDDSMLSDSNSDPD